MQHVLRWITSVILGPLILWILIKGSLFWMAALVFIVAVAALGEYLRIIVNREQCPKYHTIYGVSVVTTLLLVCAASAGSWPALSLVLVVNLFMLSLFVLWRFSSATLVFDVIARQVLGIVYIPLPLSLLLFLREIPDGVWWIIWLLIVSFLNDTGAFYTGTYRGKHLLSPHISPKKTIEGSVGGVLAAMAAGVIFALIFFQSPRLALLTLPCSFLMALAGQVGDLFESAMKRRSAIKDSGRILPGHGGMLDRIDGLLLAIPVLYGYLMVVV